MRHGSGRSHKNALTPEEVDPFLYLAKPEVLLPSDSREPSSSQSSLVPETVWHIEPPDPDKTRIPAGFQFYGAVRPPRSAPKPAPPPPVQPPHSPVEYETEPEPPKPVPQPVYAPATKWPTKRAPPPPDADADLLAMAQQQMALRNGNGPHVVTVLPRHPQPEALAPAATIASSTSGPQGSNIMAPPTQASYPLLNPVTSQEPYSSTVAPLPPPPPIMHQSPQPFSPDIVHSVVSPPESTAVQPVRYEPSKTVMSFQNQPFGAACEDPNRNVLIQAPSLQTPAPSPNAFHNPPPIGVHPMAPQPVWTQQASLGFENHQQMALRNGNGPHVVTVLPRHPQPEALAPAATIASSISGPQGSNIMAPPTQASYPLLNPVTSQEPYSSTVAPLPPPPPIMHQSPQPFSPDIVHSVVSPPESTPVQPVRYEPSKTVMSFQNQPFGAACEDPNHNVLIQAPSLQTPAPSPNAFHNPPPIGVHPMAPQPVWTQQASLGFENQQQPHVSGLQPQPTPAVPGGSREPQTMHLNLPGQPPVLTQNSPTPYYQTIVLNIPGQQPAPLENPPPQEHTNVTVNAPGPPPSQQPVAPPEEGLQSPVPHVVAAQRQDAPPRSLAPEPPSAGPHNNSTRPPTTTLKSPNPEPPSPHAVVDSPPPQPALVVNAASPAVSAPPTRSSPPPERPTPSLSSSCSTPPRRGRRDGGPPQPIVIRVEQPAPPVRPMMPTFPPRPYTPPQPSLVDFNRLVFLMSDLRGSMNQWKTDMTNNVKSSISQVEERFQTMLLMRDRTALHHQRSVTSPHKKSKKPHPEPNSTFIPPKAPPPEPEREPSFSPLPSLVFEPIPPLTIPPLPSTRKRAHKHQHSSLHSDSHTHSSTAKENEAGEGSTEAENTSTRSSIPKPEIRMPEIDPHLLATSDKDVAMLLERLQAVHDEMKRIELTYSDPPLPATDGGKQEELQQHNAMEMERVTDVLRELRGELERWMGEQATHLHEEVINMVDQKMSLVQRHTQVVQTEMERVRREAEIAVSEATGKHRKDLVANKEVLKERLRKEETLRKEEMMETLQNFRDLLMDTMKQHLQAITESGKKMINENHQRPRSSLSSMTLVIPSPKSATTRLQLEGAPKAYQEHLTKLYNEMSQMRDEVQAFAIQKQQQKAKDSGDDSTRVERGIRQIIDTVGTQARHYHEELEEVFTQLRYGEEESSLNPNCAGPVASIVTIAQKAAGMIHSAAAEQQQHLQGLVQHVSAALGQQLSQLKVAASCVERGENGKTTFCEAQRNILNDQEDQIQEVDAQLREFTRHFTSEVNKKMEHIIQRMETAVSQGSSRREKMSKLDVALQKWVMFNEMLEKKREQENHQQLQHHQQQLELQRHQQQLELQHQQQQMQIEMQKHQLELHKQQAQVEALYPPPAQHVQQQQQHEDQQRSVVDIEEDIQERYEETAPAQAYAYPPQAYYPLPPPPPAPAPASPYRPSKLPSMLQYKLDALRQELEKMEDKEAMGSDDELSTLLSDHQPDWKTESRMRKIENGVEAAKNRKAEQESLVLELKAQHDERLHELQDEHKRAMDQLQNQLDEIKQQHVEWLNNADNTSAELKKRSSDLYVEHQQRLSEVLKEKANLYSEARIAQPCPNANALQREQHALNELMNLLQQLGALRSRVDHTEQQHVEKEKARAECIKAAAKRIEAEQESTVVALCHEVLVKKKELRAQEKKAAKEADRLMQHRSESHAAQRELVHVRARRAEVQDALRDLVQQQEAQARQRAKEREQELAAELRTMKERELETLGRLSRGGSRSRPRSTLGKATSLPFSPQGLFVPAAPLAVESLPAPEPLPAPEIPPLPRVPPTTASLFRAVQPVGASPSPSVPFAGIGYGSGNLTSLYGQSVWGAGSVGPTAALPGYHSPPPMGVAHLPAGGGALPITYLPAQHYGASPQPQPAPYYTSPPEEHHHSKHKHTKEKKKKKRDSPRQQSRGEPVHSGRTWSTPPRAIYENGKLLKPPSY